MPSTEELRVVTDTELVLVREIDVNTIEEHTHCQMALWRANQDIIVGLQFAATMNPCVPLRVLLRHGELHTDITRNPPQIASDLSEGIWVNMCRSFQSMGIDLPEFPIGTMASSAGQIPRDGGNFLPLLIAIRRIVEAVTPIEARVKALAAELRRSCWQEFVYKLERGPDWMAGIYFPYAIDTIPGLTTSGRDTLMRLGLDTSAKVAAAADADLLGIKGIGPAKLKAIREWQQHVTEPNAARFDRVAR